MRRPRVLFSDDATRKLVKLDAFLTSTLPITTLVSSRVCQYILKEFVQPYERPRPQKKH